MDMHAAADSSYTVTHSRRLIGGLSFDAVFLVAVFWFMIGGWSDAWAHHHVAQLETFFTPWHAAAYSGFLACVIVLGGAVLINRFRGASWYESIPSGYKLALLSFVGFIIGGVGDAVWHTLFGIEKNIDAQFSPSHITLQIFGALFMLAPFRSLYQRREKTALVSLLLTLTVILWFSFFCVNTQTYHPFVFLWPITTPKTDVQGQTLALVSMFFQATILTGLVLYVTRRWHVYFGFWTLIILPNAIALSLMEDHYIVILVALLAGLLIDVAYLLLRPSTSRILHLRTFAAITAGGLYLIYMVILQIAYGIVWTVHLAAGVVTSTTLLGWLLSYLLVPVALEDPSVVEEGR